MTDVDDDFRSCALADLPEVAAVLLEGAAEVEAPAGTLLFGAGDTADRAFLLREGRVRLFLGDHGGGEAVLHVFGPGDLFGIPAMIGLERFPVSGETLEPSRLAVISRAALLARLAAMPEGLKGLLGLMGGRWRRMARDLAEGKALTPTQRVCRRLLAAAEQAAPGAGDDAAVAFRLDVPHHVMAGSAGLAPETVSRIFARLTAHGIRVRRRSVRVERLADLRALACREPEGSS